MQLTLLAATSSRLASTSSRKDKIETLAAVLHEARPEEIEIVVAFLSGRLRQGRIGIGFAAIRDATPTGTAIDPTLSLREVDATFDRIAGTSGSGSTREKARLLHELFTRATEDERSFLVRLLSGELRQGAVEGVMVDAVARAADAPVALVRRAHMNSGDLTEVAHVALSEGREGLGRFGIQLFRPLKPMLAQPADDVQGALDRLPDALLERKLDGARIQVHKSGDEVRIFSRRLREVTVAVPEVVDIVRALPARELILDGEAIALKPDGSPHPFQVTMRRFGRKMDDDALREKIPLTPVFFDLLRMDGDDLVDESLARRAATLESLASPEHVVPRVRAETVASATAFLRDTLRIGHEGIMAKGVDSTYQAGSRGFTWLKIKPVHTLDLVVLGAEWGHGRRKGYLSNLHLGARDPANAGFVMLGKTFKGMTDAILAWQTEKLQAIEIGRDAHTIYVRPELVAEIAFNDVQASPHYPGGLALRFARLKRYRDDKAADEADTIDTVRGIHAASS